MASPSQSVALARLRQHSKTRIRHASSPDFSNRMLELHAALEIEEFWNATRRIMHAALPFHFISVCLKPFLSMPGTSLRDRYPIKDPQVTRRLTQVHPWTPCLINGSGEEVLRLSDILPGSELRKTAFFKEFLSPWNSEFVGSMVFWLEGVFSGTITLFRRPEQGDFTEAEIDLLHQLRPQFDVALRRVLRLHRERSVRISFESFLQHLPLPTVLLTWELAPIYRNRAALDACLAWRYGLERARQFKAGKETDLPKELLDTCEAIKRSLNFYEQNDFWPGFVRPQILRCSNCPELEAQIALVQFSALPLQHPVFVVQFSGCDPSRSTEGNNEVNGVRHAQKLSRLTPTERELAVHVCQGLSNDEIATRLSKSVLTVKTQLKSIYRKLEVPSRTRLMALLAA